MLVWTNAAFLPAALLAWSRGLAFAAVAYVCLAVASSLYHACHEQRFHRLDQACALVVMAWNAQTLLLAPWNTSSVVGVILALLALVTYALARSVSYAPWHCVWHLLSGAAGWCFVQTALPY